MIRPAPIPSPKAKRQLLSPKLVRALGLFAASVGQLFPTVAWAGGSVSGAQATGLALAQVVDPLSIASASFLVQPGALRLACTSGGDCGLPHHTAFAVQGAAGREYSIAYSSSTTIPGPSGQSASCSTADGSAPDLVADSVEIRPEHTVNASEQQFSISARLVLPERSCPGVYSVPLTVAVAYQ